VRTFTVEMAMNLKKRDVVLSISSKSSLGNTTTFDVSDRISCVVLILKPLWIR
jgi:hypothetical protein